MNYPSNLPPGVTNNMIEEQCRDEFDEATEEEKQEFMKECALQEKEFRKHSPIRYKYHIPHSATATIREVLHYGERKHPVGDGFKRSPKFHAWRSLKHNLWFILTGKQYHLTHAFTRNYLALKKMYQWR